MNKAITFIQHQQHAQQPFLAFIWFHNVHTPLGKNPDLMAFYSGCTEQEQIYFSNITAIDKQIGRLRMTLRESNLADNTMVWFTSDNGPNLKGKKNPKSGALKMANLSIQRSDHLEHIAAGNEIATKEDFVSLEFLNGLLELKSLGKQTSLR